LPQRNSRKNVKPFSREKRAALSLGNRGKTKSQGTSPFPRNGETL